VRVEPVAAVEAKVRAGAGQPAAALVAVQTVVAQDQAEARLAAA
jgi:hypothetical protein